MRWGPATGPCRCDDGAAEVKPPVPGLVPPTPACPPLNAHTPPPRANVPTGHTQNIFCCKWVEPSGACAAYLATGGGGAAAAATAAAGPTAAAPAAATTHTLPSPGPGDRLILSCSGDGSVRLTDLGAGSTRVVFRHTERAKKLVLAAGSPSVALSCSEDGTSEGWGRGCGGRASAAARSWQRADGSRSGVSSV
jgi:hypothetical protein